MIIGLLQVELLIPGCNSLKEKRSVIKKHLYRIRRSYNVAVAETGKNDIWRRAELSFITVNTLRDSVERTLNKILKDLGNARDIEVLFDSIQLL